MALGSPKEALEVDEELEPIKFEKSVVVVQQVTKDLAQEFA